MRLDFEICNFADDNTIYSCGLDLHEIVTNLKSDFSRLFEWCKNIGMVANPKKIPTNVPWLEREEKTST